MEGRPGGPHLKGAYRVWGSLNNSSVMKMADFSKEIKQMGHVYQRGRRAR